MEKTMQIIRVGLYLRVSTEEQVKYGYSLDAQLKRLEDYCKEKNYKIVDVYKDEGKSARTKIQNRKELLRLIDDAKSKKFERVIIWRLDRWFRNVADYYKVNEILEKYGIDWECSDEQYNTSSALGRYVLNVKLADAQNESDKTSERIKMNFDYLVKMKRPICGSKTLPLGFTIGGSGREKKVVIDQEKEDMIKDIFHYFEITRGIKKTLLFIREKYNIDITFSAIKRVLTNTMYYGEYRGVADYCESYISKEKWCEIQDILSKNVKNNKKRFEYIFSGLVRCKECNHKMSGHTHRNNNKHEYPYYQCNYAWQNAKCSNKKRLSEKLLEKWLTENFISMIEQELKKIENLQEKQLPRKKVNKEKLLLKIDRLNELYIEGKITKEKYDSEYKKINEDLSTFSKEEKPKKDLSKYYEVLDNKSAFEIYNTLTPSMKRTFWANYIDYITQDENGDYIAVFK